MPGRGSCRHGNCENACTCEVPPIPGDTLGGVMQRLSIARSLRVALVGLTLVLAVIAALGVSSLYSARQTYENTLVHSSSLATAAANLAAAGIAEEEVLRDARGPGAAGERARAAAAYANAADIATNLARSDAAERSPDRRRDRRPGERPGAVHEWPADAGDRAQRPARAHPRARRAGRSRASPSARRRPAARHARRPGGR